MIIALPPVVSHIPGKYLCFLVTKATDRQHVNLVVLVLALTRLRDFLVERRLTSLSLPTYYPNGGNNIKGSYVLWCLRVFPKRK